jgi:hypothetical protein
MRWTESSSRSLIGPQVLTPGRRIPGIGPRTGVPHVDGAVDLDVIGADAARRWSVPAA